MMPKWVGRLLVVMLVMMTVGAVLLFGASSIKTYLSQSSEMAQAKAEAEELDNRKDELEQEIVIRSSEEGLRREALCFNYYVKPGVEVYATEVYSDDTQTVWNVSGC